MCTIFLTFVAIDENGAPSPVPQIIPETEEEKKLYNSAKERAELRKTEKRK